MAKVKYLAKDSGADEVSAFGYDFKDGKSVDVKPADVLRFEGNPFFDVSGDTPKKTKDTSTDDDNKDGEDDGSLKAVHIAGGRYSIKRGDEELKKGLNKEEAASFNGMSDEDKAEYVAE